MNKLLAALAVAAAATLLLAARPASAGAPDVSGAWTADYSLACSGSLDQVGNDVSGTLECGSDITIAVMGSMRASDGAVALSGMFATIPVTITGTLAQDGGSIEGVWSAPPLVEGGEFFAVRQSEPSSDNIDGFWLVDARNIFSSECTVDIEQDGVALTGDVACEGGPRGTLTGQFDPETGNISMSGPFGALGDLEVRVSVSDDGRSYSGAWRLLPDGPAGVMTGERLAAPTSTPRPARDRDADEETPTPTVQLPDAGSGAPNGPSPWLPLAIAALLAVGGVSFVAAFRLR